MNGKDIKAIYALDGDKMKFRHNYSQRSGGNGFGLSDSNVCFTLTATDRHMVAIVHEKRNDFCEGCKSPTQGWRG